MDIKKEKVKKILDKLYKVYPNPKTELNYKSPFQLLVAVILSAQATDKSVNKATKSLFERFPTAKKMSQSSPEEINQYINTINFHNNKSKNIFKTSVILVEKYNGIIPDKLEELIKLPGVARKTANVVLGDIFKKPEGIVVDTHVIRLSKKLGLTNNSDAVKIEKDLMKIVPFKHWINFSHLLILHGREICKAKPHKCLNCPLGQMCPCK